jgi:hypothetical protein
MSGFREILTKSRGYAQSAKARIGTLQGASQKRNEMDKEPIDPVYEYVDKEIKSAKRELQNKITIVAENLLETSRFLARRDIEQFRMGLTQWSAKRLSKSTVPTYSKVHQFLLSHSATAKEKTRHSHDPLSVAMEFRKECEDYFKENALHPFID